MALKAGWSTMLIGTPVAKKISVQLLLFVFQRFYTALNRSGIFCSLSLSLLCKTNTVCTLRDDAGIKTKLF